MQQLIGVKISHGLSEPCEVFREAFGFAPDISGAVIQSLPRVLITRVRPRIHVGTRPLGTPSLDLITTLNSLHGTLPKSALTVNGRVCGIDLVKRGHEVKKLLHAGFGPYMARKGYDPDDVLQEVYKGLIARNHGKCPWDVSKSSFGHYVHMVCACVLSNYARKMRRREQFERVGMRDVDGTEVDARELAVEVIGGVGMDAEILQEMSSWVREDVKHPSVPLTILPLAAQGYGKAEIAHITGLPETVVDSGLRDLRQSLRRRP